MEFLAKRVKMEHLDQRYTFHELNTLFKINDFFKTFFFFILKGATGPHGPMGAPGPMVKYLKFFFIVFTAVVIGLKLK